MQSILKIKILNKHIIGLLYAASVFKMTWEVHILQYKQVTDLRYPAVNLLYAVI